ncbi:unnamed protein product [Effrenium voratum]|uniref:2'-phosphotransferase n=1 Tax=Effrenium voratum TaxID=2562239 RepID=A0AA36I8E3_9DINO|nr:unnamed protein product [Effrenium voratum]
MHLANQISTLVAAKCTSKLQITDSDFSKQFKSLVKRKLQQLRHDFQQKYQQDAAWKVGSLEILESVVFAQEEMSKKNLEDEWVLKAAIRNGILGYIPSGGKLQKVTECSWAQAEGFQMGTKRIPSDWFKDRFSWLSPDGKPIEPDWSLSDSASEIADLQRWDYHSKEDEQHDSADEGQHLELVEIEGELEEQLELSLENSLNLRLHPSLRRALHKRLADPAFEEQLKLRQLARDELRKVTQQKLQNHSRREKKKKSSAKSSKVAEKITDVKKAEKAEKAKKPALEEPLPLEEQVEEQAEEQVDSARGFLKKEVIVTSEAAGKLAFGQDGTAHFWSPSSGRYNILTTSGTFMVLPEEVELKVPQKVKTFQWPAFRQLSREEMRLMLQQLYCLPEDGLGEVDLLAGVHKDTVLLEDQHIQMGWSLLSWALQKSGAAIPSDQFGIVDSALTRNIALQVHVEHKQFLIQKLKNHLERHSVLCVPIFSENPSHWTLLVVDQRFSPAQLRWYDSLQHQSQDAIQAATLVAEWLQLAGFEPLRVNSAFQDNSDCGWWVLNYLELEARKLRGETITLWPASRAQYWKSRLIQISASLAKELSKVQTQLENDIKKRQDKEKKAQAAKAAAEEKLSSMKNKESAAAAKAKELIETNSLRVTWKDLTLEEKHQIKSLQGAPEETQLQAEIGRAPSEESSGKRRKLENKEVENQEQAIFSHAESFQMTIDSYAEEKVQQEKELKVLWVEPPWAADSVLAGGLTDRSRWSLSARMWQRLTRCSCCLPFLCATRRGIATGGGRGAPRRDAKRPKAKRLTHFVSLRMGEEVRQAAVQLQKEMLDRTGELRGEVERQPKPSWTMWRLPGQALASSCRASTSSLRACSSRASARIPLPPCGRSGGAWRPLLKESVVSLPSALSPAPPEVPSEVSTERLSRYMTKVLRHDARRLGLAMRADGSVAVQELLGLPFFQHNGFGELDVEREVRVNGKQRFSLWMEDGTKRVRANQGHKMKEVQDSELLSPIRSATELPVCIHGTYISRWHAKKQSHVDVWSVIKTEGLKTMGRNHIHFVPHEVGSRTVISGMRQDCTVAIYLNVPKALENGIQLFRSSNNVVLTRGDAAGHIPPDLFLKAVEIKTGRALWPQEEQPGTDASDVSEGEDGWTPHVTLAKCRRRKGTKSIPKSCWEALREVDLGMVEARSLHLCQLKGDKETGYYVVDHEVSL